jgi:hypothetical protein
MLAAVAVLTEIAEELARLRESGMLRAAFRLCQERHAPLSSYPDVEEVISACRVLENDYEAKDEVVRALCLEVSGAPEVSEGTQGSQVAGLLLVWLFLPGLRLAAWRFSAAYELVNPEDIADIEAELVAGFWEAVGAVGPETRRVCGHLVIGARRRAWQALREAVGYQTQIEWQLEALSELEGPRTHAADFRGPEDVLREAFRARILSEIELILIDQTRLEGASVVEVGRRLGLKAQAAYKRRSRAEARLGAWLQRKSPPNPAFYVQTSPQKCFEECRTCGAEPPRWAVAETRKGGENPVELRPADRPFLPHRRERAMKSLRDGAAVLAAEAGMEQIVGILDSLRNALVAVLSALAMVMLTYAGIRYLIAGGDPIGIEKAKGAARSAFVGFALALLAPVLVGIVKQIIG